MSVVVIPSSGNAFIDALPEAMSMHDRMERLTVPPYPPHRDEERGLPHHLRREAVLRLRGYFKAGLKHGRWAEGLYFFIKEGYRGRNSDPVERDRQMLALSDHAGVGAALPPPSPIGISNKAGSAGFFGFAGMGKTFMVEHALSFYRQVVPHDGAAQIVWLKLDCPPEGGLRELCIRFFHAVDDALGRPFYAGIHAGHTASEESMLIAMRRVARNHALGCLVIDEIQHLLGQGADDNRLRTFLVNLVNDIGVPVLMVGTLEADEVIGRSATLSRRMVGLGGGKWERLVARTDGQRGEWEAFVEDLWRYQWTDAHTELTDGLRTTLYEETQGIVDLVVKLFCIVQMRLILIGEGLSRQMGNPPPELITVEKIRECAREEFGPVREMLTALAHGNHAKAKRFGDYSKLQKALALKVEGLAAPEFVVEPPVPEPVPSEPVLDDAGVAEQLAEDERMVAGLLSRCGHAEDIVAAAIRRAKVALGDAPAIVPNLLPAAQAELARPDGKPVPANDVLEEPLVDGDLRAVARVSVASGHTVYEGLCAAGLAGATAALRVA